MILGLTTLAMLQAASQLLRMLTKEEPAHKLVDLRELLAPPTVTRGLERAGWRAYGGVNGSRGAYMSSGVLVWAGMSRKHGEGVKVDRGQCMV